MSFLIHLKGFLKFLVDALRYNTKVSIFFSQLINEIYLIGYESISLMSLLSFSIGFVTALQLISMLGGYFMPDYLIVAGLKNTMLLEFMPTILCFIFIGRNITSLACQLFDMKRSGFYDNLKVIGVNTTSFACLPKIISCTISFPLLTTFTCILSVFGTYLYCFFFNIMTSASFLESLVTVLNRGLISFCFFKATIFGFLCGAIGSYLGFCYYINSNKDIISVNQHCFTVLCITLLVFDIILNLFKPLFIDLA